MDDKPKPKHRWYQFSLRTMLIVMVLSSAVFGSWVHRSREWIRQRHKASGEILIIYQTKHHPLAPGGLWLFGEEGVEELVCLSRNAERAKQLFPEAVVDVDDQVHGWR